MPHVAVTGCHQFIPGESHDFDEVYEALLIEHGGVASSFKMGKLGILSYGYCQLERNSI